MSRDATIWTTSRLHFWTAAAVASIAGALTGGVPHRDQTRWIALYAGGPSDFTPTYPPYTTADLTTYVAVSDSSGKPVGWLTSGALFLEIYSSAKHMFATWGKGRAPASGKDWEAYADSLTALDGPLGRLDSAVTRVSAALGPPVQPYRFVVMIPYPPGGPDSLTFLGHAYFMGDWRGRVALVHDYVEEMRQRLSPRRFPHLAFDGFLWLREEVPPGDSLVLPAVATIVHGVGARFLWVPYFHPGAAAWRRWGFDEAWLQPNYFFHPELPQTRLDSAVAKARAWDMGLEIEFNSKMFSSPQFEDRLDPYLSQLSAAADLRARAIVVYDGAGALLQLARNQNPRARAVYARLVDVLHPEQGGVR